MKRAAGHGGCTGNLQQIAERDPEQEVQGMAVPVLEACLQTFRDQVPDDPILTAIRDVVSPESVAEGQPARVVDAQLVAGQLAEALGREQGDAGPVGVGPTGPNIMDMEF